jgi:Mg2+ and Co2+ transporter CorA
MNAKERRHVRNLEIKIEQLEQALNRSQSTWRDQFHEIYESRTALFQAFAAVEEAAVIMHQAIKNDPQFMAEQNQRRLTVEANF